MSGAGEVYGAATQTRRGGRPFLCQGELTVAAIALPVCEAKEIQ